jgi:hypothetical protein
LRNTSGEEAGIAETTLDEIALKIVSHALSGGCRSQPESTGFEPMGTDYRPCADRNPQAAEKQPTELKAAHVVQGYSCGRETLAN